MVPAALVPLIVAPIASGLTANLLYKLNRLRVEAEAARAEQERFTANISHEIRTPINGIMGLAEMLLESELTQEQRENTNTILASSEALLRIINDILDQAKLETGQDKPHMAPFDLQDVLSEAISLLRPEARKKDVSIGLRYGSVIPGSVLGDADRLRQILLNLLGNAVKFTNKGQVTVFVSYNEDRALPLHISVADQGIGIPESEHSSVFQPFHRVSAPDRAHIQGTGLGLSICKQLIGLMGGEIDLVSTEGQGATFTLRLPWEETVAAPKPMVGAVCAQNLPIRSEDIACIPIEPINFTGRRILVADDNRTNRMIMEKMLVPTGAELHLCDDGEKAVRKFQEVDFDLVLLDVSMPIMDGLTAARQIRDLEAAERLKHDGSVPAPHCPLLAFTANAQDSDRQRCAEAGMDGFLTKPIRKADLLGRLETAMAQSTAQAGQDKSGPKEIWPALRRPKSIEREY